MWGITVQLNNGETVVGYSGKEEMGIFELYLNNGGEKRINIKDIHYAYQFKGKWISDLYKDGKRIYGKWK